jgi:hypothetical protein
MSMDFAGKIGDFSKKAALAFAAVAAAAGAMAIKIGVDAVKAASDLSETISKVGVLFGDTADDIEKFADGAASSLGQTKQQALDAAATFATFGKSAGLSGKDLSKFSIDFVKLSSDLASFNNTSPEQAINAIGSALRGEAEPLRQYGVLLDDASLRQAALELGIISTTKNALTPQQKVLAAQALIYKQTGTAQGDFERTSDGLANKTRILTAQLENAKVTIGEALLPIVLELANLFSEKVIPIVQKVADAFGSKADGMGGTLSTLANSIKSFVQPIFEGFKSAFDKIKKTVIENKDEFKAFFDVIKAAAPIIGKVIGSSFQRCRRLLQALRFQHYGKCRWSFENLINTAIDLINVAIRGFNLIKPGARHCTGFKDWLFQADQAPQVEFLCQLASLPSGFTARRYIISWWHNRRWHNHNHSTTGGGSSRNSWRCGHKNCKRHRLLMMLLELLTISASGTTTLAAVMAKKSNDAFKFGTSGVNTNTLAGILAASNKPKCDCEFQRSHNRSRRHSSCAGGYNQQFLLPRHRRRNQFSGQIEHEHF